MSENDPDDRFVFAGLDACSDASLPNWFAAQRPGTDATSLAAAIRELPRAATTDVAYRNPCSGEWVRTDQHVALVAPSRLRAQAVGRDSADPLFHIPSNAYTVLNPTEIYGPLGTVLRETVIDGRQLADVAFGEIRTYRNGGEVHMDLLFDGLEVSLPGRQADDPVAVGITTGYDFFGGHAVYVEGYAQDIRCTNSLRQVTDRETIKHVGDPDTFTEWWRERLRDLDLLRDDLVACIRNAREVTVEFETLPFGPGEFYELLGLPGYLAETAAAEVLAGAGSSQDLNLWRLHSGATYALTHEFRGREGSTLDGYVRAANDLLFNPELSIERIVEAYERAPEQDDSDSTAAGEVRERLEEQVETFERRQAALQDRVE